MTDEGWWAARYAFCEELWRDRPRIVWDRRLESALWAMPADEKHGETGALASLLDGLLPRRSSGDDRNDRTSKRIDVSMGVADDAIGRRLAPRRPGTQFLGLAALCDAIRRRSWEVALVDVSDLLLHDGMGGATRLSVQGTDLIAALSSRMAEGGRTIVLSGAAEPPGQVRAPQGRRGDPKGGALDYGAWLQLLTELSPDALPTRVYGVLRPTMVAIVELPTEDEPREATMEHARSGPPHDGTLPVAAMRALRSEETDEDSKTADVAAQVPGSTARRGSGTWRDGKPRAARWSSEADVESTRPLPSRGSGVPTDASEPDDEDVPLSFDNTLGSQQPTILEYIAIIGDAHGVELAEGMTLVELPAPVADAGSSTEARLASASVDAGAAPGAVRMQLVEAQRQADLSAIERHGLLERLDALDTTNIELRAQAAELRDRLARALSEPAAAVSTERLDAAHAELQTLRWHLTQTQRSLDAARARPVETLESEVARLTALLGSSAIAPPADGPEAGAAVYDTPAVREVSPPRTGLSEPANGTQSVLALIAAVDGLQRRLERSDISALQLRKGLLALRQGLARLLPTTR